MHTRLQKHLQASSVSTSTAVPNPFQSRPFAVQVKPEQSSLQQQETPDLEEQREKVKPVGYSLANISITPPKPPSVPSIQLKLAIGKPGDKYEQKVGNSIESFASENVLSATRPNISFLHTPSIQASFISFVAKMGAKRVSLGILKNFIKTQIQDKIKKIALKKFAKQFIKEADDLVGILEDPWWVTAIGFIPVFGDVFDLARVPKQIATAMKKADALEAKVKNILRIQGKKAGDLIPATLKKSESYFADLESHTYTEILELAERGSVEAKKMKKLIEQTERLMEKL